MLPQNELKDLGCRRRAIRRQHGELDYDLQARRHMERQVRKMARLGRVIWIGAPRRGSFPKRSA